MNERERERVRVVNCSARLLVILTDEQPIALKPAASADCVPRAIVGGDDTACEIGPVPEEACECRAS